MAAASWVQQHQLLWMMMCSLNKAAEAMFNCQFTHIAEAADIAASQKCYTLNSCAIVMLDHKHPPFLHHALGSKGQSTSYNR